MSTHKHKKIARVKRYLVHLRGGKCQKCGCVPKVLAAFTFHHRQPWLKKFCLSGANLVRYPMREVLQELWKTDLLCLNCHAEVHN
jgi:hypothetical protein